MQRSWLMLAVWGVVAGGVLVGCGHSGGGRWAAERAKYLLTQEPADAVSVLDLEESAPPAGEITLVGKVGGVPNPWTEGQAAFVIADPARDDGHGGEHHACGDNCPYCAKKKAGQPATSGLALVQVVDDAGVVVPVDARTLFDLEESQTVVIRGRAEKNASGHLIVSARGLYIRR